MYFSEFRSNAQSGYSYYYVDHDFVWCSEPINIFRTGIQEASVSDPYSFFPDPDPEVEAGGQYGSGSNPDPGL
jgi:hypothetical protein